MSLTRVGPASSRRMIASRLGSARPRNRAVCCASVTSVSPMDIYYAGYVSLAGDIVAAVVAVRLRRGRAERVPRAAVRSWVLGAVRRPARAAVVVATLIVMTVGTTSSLVAADSLEQLFIQDARAQWGPVDVEVTSAEGAVLEESLARSVGDEAEQVSVAWAPRLILRTVAKVGDRRDPDTMIMGVGPEEQLYPPLRSVAGTNDPLLLDPDEMLINERAARRLGAAVGDRVDLVVSIPEILEEVPGRDTKFRREPEAVEATFRVVGVVANDALGDLRRAPNLIVRRDVLQRLTLLEGRVTQLHMTATSDAAGAADELVRQIDPFLRQVGLTAATVADDALVLALDEGDQFRSILLTLAALAIAAAAVATVEMLVSLAEERAREIAVLRALGAPARTATVVVVGESLLYAVVAVAIGVALAVPAGTAIARLLSDHFAELSAGRGQEQVRLVPVLEPGTLITAVATVLISAAAAGRAAGRRLGAVAPDALLRGLGGRLPPLPLSGRRPVVVALFGAMLLGTGLAGGVASDALRYMGVTLLLTAWWLHLRRAAVDVRRVDTYAAVVALAWSTLGAAALADFSQGYETGFGVLVVAGVVSIAATTALVTPRFRRVMRFLRSYAPSGPWQAALRTAGAYAETLAGRSGRLHATFGIVLFTAAALQVLGSATQLDVNRQSGGFDVVGETVAEMDVRQLSKLPGVRLAAATESTYVGETQYGVRPHDDDEAPQLRLRYPVRLVAADSTLTTTQGFALADALPRYPDVAAALDAVERDANKAVVDRYALPPGARVGQDVVLDVGGSERSYELIAVIDSFLLGSVFLAEQEVGQIVPSAGPTLLLADAADGTSPEQLAADLERAGAEIGLDAKTMTELADDVVSVNRTFTDVFALMLLIGLAVALIAVAAALVRAGQERRPHLAVLRAMGFRRRTATLALAAEPIAVAGVGAVAGLAVGVLVLRLLFAAGFSNLAFVIDVPRTLLTLTAILMLLVVACLIAARAAVARAKPEALRESV